MSNLVVEVGKILQRMLYRLVEDAIRKKVVKTGWTG
jgi:hypothetical protein